MTHCRIEVDPLNDQRFEGCICEQDHHFKECPAIKTGKCHFQSLYETGFQTHLDYFDVRGMPNDFKQHMNEAEAKKEEFGIHEKLKSLGNKVASPKTPEEAILETFKNTSPDYDYVVRFSCPEFTSRCPVTDQPDYAHFLIDYVPDELLVESKALKLFLGSFRDVGSFHEACSMKIARRLVEAMKPKWLRLAGYWYPRGGISIDTFYQTGDPPTNVYIPHLSVEIHRGRG